MLRRRAPRHYYIFTRDMPWRGGFLYAMRPLIFLFAIRRWYCHYYYYILYDAASRFRRFYYAKDARGPGGERQTTWCRDDDDIIDERHYYDMILLLYAHIIYRGEHFDIRHWLLLRFQRYDIIIMIAPYSLLPSRLPPPSSLLFLKSYAIFFFSPPR